MTKNVLYCFEDDPIEDAAKLMEAAQVRRLEVLTRDKRLTGTKTTAGALRKGTRILGSCFFGGIEGEINSGGFAQAWGVNQGEVNRPSATATK